jgi:2-dehydropantoate 2-reductase
VRFIVYGAGAVGGVLGGRLFEAGHDVTLIARGDHLAAIRRDGLRIDSPEGSRVVPVPAVASPSEARPGVGDVVLLAMKSGGTAAALAELTAAADPDITVVSLQNAVANEPAALRLFERVYGVCVMLPAGHLDPGVVLQHCAPTPGILDVGRYPDTDADPDAGAVALAEAFRSAGFVSEPRAGIMRWKYRKLIVSLSNGVQAACRDTPARGELVARVRDEGEAALAAAGIPVVTAAEDAERRGDILRTGEIDGAVRPGPSSWQSLYRGTGSIEADWFNGEIVLLGRLHGVPTPANELVRRAANHLARTHGRPASLTAEDLLAHLPAAAG